MQIFYLGGPAIKIQANPLLQSQQEVTVLINPFGVIKGISKLRKQHADLVLVTRTDPSYYDSKIHSKEAYVIDSQGEFETKGIIVYSLDAPDDAKEKTIIFRIDIEDIRIVYLGGLVKPINGPILEHLEGSDILIIPIGGKGVLTAHEAITLVNDLEPRIIIPIEYKNKKYPIYKETSDQFVKEFGAKQTIILNKLRVTRKDLPHDERQLAILE